MNKEQIIEDMAQNHICKLLKRHCETCIHCSCYEQAERNYDKGYRKQSDTAKEIFTDLWSLFKTESCSRTIKEKAEIYGVELI